MRSPDTLAAACATPWSTDSDSEPLLMTQAVASSAARSARSDGLNQEPARSSAPSAGFHDALSDSWCTAGPTFLFPTEATGVVTLDQVNSRLIHTGTLLSLLVGNEVKNPTGA